MFELTNHSSKKISPVKKIRKKSRREKVQIIDYSNLQTQRSEIEGNANPQSVSKLEKYYNPLPGDSHKTKHGYPDCKEIKLYPNSQETIVLKIARNGYREKSQRIKETYIRKCNSKHRSDQVVTKKYRKSKGCKKTETTDSKSLKILLKDCKNHRNAKLRHKNITEYATSNREKGEEEILTEFECVGKKSAQHFSTIKT